MKNTILTSPAGIGVITDFVNKCEKEGTDYRIIDMLTCSIDFVGSAFGSFEFGVPYPKEDKTIGWCNPKWFPSEDSKEHKETGVLFFNDIESASSNNYLKVKEIFEQGTLNGKKMKDGWTCIIRIVK